MTNDDPGSQCLRGSSRFEPRPLWHHGWHECRYQLLVWIFIADQWAGRGFLFLFDLSRELDQDTKQKKVFGWFVSRITHKNNSTDSHETWRDFQSRPSRIDNINFWCRLSVIFKHNYQFLREQRIDLRAYSGCWWASVKVRPLRAGWNVKWLSRLISD